MKNITYKIVQWSTPEELHEECMDWLSQLEFIKDEQRFLDELITKYTIPLISLEGDDTSLPIVVKLLKDETALHLLITRVQSHNNTFEKILETHIDKREKEGYKETHYHNKIAVFKYIREYQKMKSTLFKKIKEIMKKEHHKKTSN
ncbi:hypothetical protein [Rasiella sp. SM2506]|uniref:hypothetical protein n=1 Tax=Rasiella sp. SM2506 TaxID=3423914 RepID=UPI003D7A9410